MTFNRLIIAGGRDLDVPLEDALSWLDRLADRHRFPVLVLSGGCRGADQVGEGWAEEHGIPVVRYLPDWRTHGKAAGPIRNREMACEADAVALFPGGSGTADMRKAAHDAGLEVYCYPGLERVPA